MGISSWIKLHVWVGLNLYNTPIKDSKDIQGLRCRRRKRSCSDSNGRAWDHQSGSAPPGGRDVDDQPTWHGVPMAMPHGHMVQWQCSQVTSSCPTSQQCIHHFGYHGYGHRSGPGCYAPTNLLQQTKRLMGLHQHSTTGSQLINVPPSRQYIRIFPKSDFPFNVPACLCSTQQQKCYKFMSWIAVFLHGCLSIWHHTKFLLRNFAPARGIFNEVPPIVCLAETKKNEAPTIGSSE